MGIVFLLLDASVWLSFRLLRMRPCSRKKDRDKRGAVSLLASAMCTPSKLISPTSCIHVWRIPSWPLWLLTCPASAAEFRSHLYAWRDTSYSSAYYCTGTLIVRKGFSRTGENTAKLKRDCIVNIKSKWNGVLKGPRVL